MAKEECTLQGMQRSLLHEIGNFQTLSLEKRGNMHRVFPLLGHKKLESIRGRLDKCDSILESLHSEFHLLPQNVEQLQEEEEQRGKALNSVSPRMHQVRAIHAEIDAEIDKFFPLVCGYYVTKKFAIQCLQWGAVVVFVSYGWLPHMVANLLSGG